MPAASRHPAAAGIVARFTPVITWRAEDFEAVAMEHVQWFAREFPFLEETRRLTRAESNKLIEIQAEVIARMEAGDMQGFRSQLDRAKRAWTLMLGSETPLGGEFTPEDLKWNAGIPTRRAERESAERRATEFDRGWKELQTEMAKVREAEERAVAAKVSGPAEGADVGGGGAPGLTRDKTAVRRPPQAGRLFDLPTPDPTGQGGPFAGPASARRVNDGGKAHVAPAGAQATRNDDTAAGGGDRPPTPSSPSPQTPGSPGRLKNYAEEV